MNELSLGAMPSHLIPANPDTNSVIAQAAAQMASNYYNRINLRGREFRFVVKGNETVHPQKHLDVIILNAQPAIGRLYYGTKYDPNANEHSAPTCWSQDGVTPASTVPNPQGVKCETCPMNAKGSAITDTGNKSRACGFVLRLVCLVPGLPAENGANIYQLDVKAMSLFGDSNQEQRLFSYTNYVQALATLGVSDYHQVVTRLTFTPDSVPALHFHPLQWTDDDWFNYAHQLLEDNDKYENYLSVSGGKLEDKTVNVQGNPTISQQADPRVATAHVEDVAHTYTPPAQAAPAPQAAAPAPAPAPAPAAPTPSPAAPAPAAPAPQAAAPAPQAAAPAPAAPAPQAAAPAPVAPAPQAAAPAPPNPAGPAAGAAAGQVSPPAPAAAPTSPQAQTPAQSPSVTSDAALDDLLKQVANAT